METTFGNIDPLLERLSATAKPIVLYGMGNGAEKIISLLEKNDLQVSGVFASDGFVRGHRFHGYEVLDYKEACKRFGGMVVLLCFGTSRADVLANIDRISSEQELYAPDIEVCGEGFYTPRHYMRDRDDLDHICDLLSDDLSRLTFENMIKFKLSGDIARLKECETDTREVYREVLRPTGQEIFADAGAYDGDSVLEFVKYAGSYRFIHAIEPDSRSFKKLLKNTSGLTDISCVNAAVHDTDGFVPFDTRAGRQSAISQAGTDKIASVSIDRAVPEATFIKMDVEGNEAAAITGAAHTIRRNRPRLAVSAYHRHSDLLLPLRILKIRSDYKVYMRHLRYYPAWDTLYYFV